jgi:G3E family GTPase
VANKTDTCDEQDKENFYQFAQSIQPVKAAWGWVEQGAFNLEFLDIECDQNRPSQSSQHAHHHSSTSKEKIIKLVRLEPGQDYQSFENQGMGYYSLGWLLAEDQVFNHHALTAWLTQLKVERLKGLLITNQGSRVMNLKDQVLTEMPTRKLQQSRIEIIHNQALDKDVLEKTLLNCLVASAQHKSARKY